MSYLIRRTTRDDAEAVARHFTDESAYTGTLQLPYPSLELWRERLAQQDGVVHLVACTPDDIVGNIGLHTNAKTPRRAHAASLGIGRRVRSGPDAHGARATGALTLDEVQGRRDRLTYSCTTLPH